MGSRFAGIKARPHSRTATGELTRLSLDTITIRHACLPDKFRLAAAAGYAGLELWGTEIDEMPDAIETILRLVREHGLCIEGVCPDRDLYRWHYEWDEALEQTLEERLPRYAAIGARYLVLPVMSEQGTLADTTTHFCRLCRIAARHGLGVGLEPIGHVRKLSQIADAMKVLRRADGIADSGLVLDVFHFFRGGNRLDALQAIDPADVIAVHIDDALDRPLHELVGYRHRVYPGHGIFDVIGFCAAMHRMCYAGPYVVELLNETYWQADPAEVSAAAYRASRDVLFAAANLAESSK